MLPAIRVQRASARTSVVRMSAVSFLSAIVLAAAQAQGPDPAALSPHEAGSIALPLAEDRGSAALEQALRRLNTTASVMMIVAHPDDEDGPLLTYLSRVQGVRTILYTLTRGEGGQNAMGAETYNALGLIRTNELLTADQYYGVTQMWGTQADFGFSKTQEESFARWDHNRVLYDAVLAVRRMRPQVIISTFVGAVSDGHGHHQVSGEIAQEVFKAAADPKVFPDQLKDGIEPWQPLAVYGMTPFAPITDKGIFDYATGKWAPARFKNYVTGETISTALSADVTISVGDRDPILGRSPVQIAREGWGMQKSQYGGASPALSGPSTTSYHLWAVAPSAAQKADTAAPDLFTNSRVTIPTHIYLAGSTAPAWLTNEIHSIGDSFHLFFIQRLKGHEDPTRLAKIYKQTLDLRTHIGAATDLTPQAKASLLLELDYKLDTFQSALKELLGLNLTAFRTNGGGGGGGRGASADETPASVSPGEDFHVRIHTTQSGNAATLSKAWLESRTGDPWSAESDAKIGTDTLFRVKASANAQPTAPYFTRPTTEQPYYDISNPAWRGRSLAPWPLEAHVEYTFDGAPLRLSTVVQTLQHATGPGGFYEPLVVTPAIGVSMTPEARIVPLDGSPLPVKVVVHTQTAAEGTISLKLPAGWHSEPAEAHFARKSSGDTEPILFSVTTDGAQSGAYTVQAVVKSGNATYTSGWSRIGYQGLRPYNLYKAAELKTRKIDVKLAPSLKIGYIMGAGDLVPEAIEALGVMPHMLSSSELASSNLSAFNVIVIGIRAYQTRPELAAAQPRLDAFVRNGGNLIVQYQRSTFPAPVPLNLGSRPENVVDETAPVKLLAPQDPLLRSPNIITTADFDGWVEERGHSFLDTWDSGYTALTETADAGQDPQRGGLIVAHPGKGTYIYVAYALYRQLPELVPGSYRLLANLLSANAAK
ncbi:PIG-L family deacetylase [Terracidiphilus gabretensis]|uniref:PIG-L family deacetylase n=1 Tax=Terracidiphilus gabretensis TaxID=1577687 RepID=UPI00071BFC24|nr:PIG-L family deacetylase [Terracidiphilus gabretensis]